MGRMNRYILYTISGGMQATIPQEQGPVNYYRILEGIQVTSPRGYLSAVLSSPSRPSRPITTISVPPRDADSRCHDITPGLALSFQSWGQCFVLLSLMH